MKMINQLGINQLFKLPASDVLYRYQGSWLNDPGTWEYQYQNNDKSDVHIISKLIEVIPVEENDDTVEGLKRQIEELREEIQDLLDAKAEGRYNVLSD